MIIHLGAFGQTIFALREATGVEGDKLILRQRDGKVEIGHAEIRVIASLAKAVGLQPHPITVQRMKERLNIT